MGWFTKNKQAPRRPRMEVANDYLPQAKPFTRALMLRAAQYQDEAYDDLKKMLGSVKHYEDEKTFEEFVESSAITIAHKISEIGAQHIGRTTAFMPHSPPPADAPYVMGFGLCTLLGIVQYLAADDIKIEIKKAVGSLAGLYYQFHPEDELGKFGMEGVEVFQEILKADHENIIQWRENLRKLVQIYVMQWTTDDVEIKEIDCKPLFGQMLGSLINAFTKKG